MNMHLSVPQPVILQNTLTGRGTVVIKARKASGWLWGCRPGQESAQAVEVLTMKVDCGTDTRTHSWAGEENDQQGNTAVILIPRLHDTTGCHTGCIV